MTEDQIELVQTTWNKITPYSEKFITDTYRTLFALEPALKPLFHLPPEVLVSKMAYTLNAVLTSLRNIDEIRFILLRLGAHHVGYGAQIPHFALLKTALTQTLQQHLGDDLTEQAADAWSQAYDLISTILIEGMEKQRQTLNK
ncbi:globin domain-containing protein [Deefgea rivuli]|uniref:globin domain-containing protein n=1 Tax=Deefgea rivuli TaxID=400948 RepID=UPI0004871D7B|nr:globin domain-containing protein [Deefgea rivuli]